MNHRFSQTAAASMPDGDRRRPLAAAAEQAEVPSIETEEWRYSPIGDLALDQLEPVLADPGLDGGREVERYADVIVERAATVVIVDGWIVDVEVEPGWLDKGLDLLVDAEATGHGAADRPTDRATDGARGDTDTDTGEAEETVFDLLHRAFTPAPLRIQVPTGLSVGPPIVILNHQRGEGRGAFSHVVVEAADGSDVTVVERQTSAAGAGLSVPLTELRAGPAARLRYQTIQELGTDHWQLGRLRSSAAGQATLAVGIAAFGARYARLRADSRLTGRGATGNLVAAYYGDGQQVHDFRVFQHHDARDTRSDLLFKGAQDDASGSIYTGLIHIHPDGAGTNAFQTNRNIKLSPDAWAWSVPNLEIENNDVHCSHASTVSPVDEDQQFYLHSRGVPPVIADRLIVAGFFDEVIDRLPVEATRPAVSELIAAKLDRRNES